MIMTIQDFLQVWEDNVVMIIMTSGIFFMSRHYKFCKKTHAFSATPPKVNNKDNDHAHGDRIMIILSQGLK